jgi:pimeloyl-ACP methyl ester carboxylesterase
MAMADTVMARPTTDIRPFRIDVPVESIIDLKRRLAAARWPDKGGHFAAWEQPELFSGEVRAAFRSLR